MLRINSGGGALYEIPRLHDLIEQDLKPKFRVVAWIQSAISAAAMTAHVIEEIYFMPEGNYGACTGWRGSGDAIEGRALEDVLAQMERASAKGGYDYRIMRAMQIPDPLSADIDENGEVTYRLDEDGQILLNREGDILTFNSETARMVGFSRGTASTVEELTTAMGLEEIDWVGEYYPGSLYPVSKAEQAVREFRNTTFEDQRRTNEYLTSYQRALDRLRGTQDARARGAAANQARTALGQIKRMIDNNPNFALFTLGILPETFPEWYREQLRMIDDLRKG